MRERIREWRRRVNRNSNYPVASRGGRLPGGMACMGNDDRAGQAAGVWVRAGWGWMNAAPRRRLPEATQAVAYGQRGVTGSCRWSGSHEERL